MAYNPFDFFRRNQKILFSIITVIIMIMFTLSWGSGDVFQKLPNWIGSMSSHGEVMAVIDGSKIRESKLGELQKQRRVANQYLKGLASKSLNRQMEFIQTNRTKLSKENSSTLLMALNPNMMRDPRTAKLVDEGVGKVIANEKAPQIDRDFATAIRLFNALILRSDPSLETFFISMPNRTNRDLLEFILWDKKATALGVKLTGEDVDSLIEKELPGITLQDRKEVYEALVRERANVTKSSLESALVQEFQVRAAQMALLGSESIRVLETRAVRIGYGTPHDVYTTYDELTTPNHYMILNLPVESFEPLVQGQPTEAELRDIHSKTSRIEPDPGSPKLGVKVPRKLKLQWIEATGDEAYYKAAGADWMKKADLMAKLSGSLMEAFAGTSLAGVTSAYLLTQNEPLFQAAYATYKEQHQSEIASRWYGNQSGNRVLDTSFTKPQTIASIVGMSIAGGWTSSSPACLQGTLVSAQQTAIRQETVARIRAGLPFLVPGALPTLAGFTANAISHAAALPDAFPVATVKASLLEQAAKVFPYDVARADLGQFQKDVLKASEGKLDKAAAAKVVIDNFVKSRGVRLGQSEQFLDVHNIGNDPGLLPLKSALQSVHSVNDPNFGRRFFFNEAPPAAPGDRSPPRETPTSTFFDPAPYPDSTITGPRAEQVLPGGRRSESARQFLVWRIEETPAEVLDFARAKEACAKVWRRLKARELAKNAADEVLKKLNGCGDNLPAVIKAFNQTKSELPTILKAEINAKSFDIFDVAPMNVISLGQGMSFAMPYQLRPGDDVRYPSAKMQIDLLSTNSKPVGTAIVLVDEPIASYYVAVLANKAARGERSFADQVFPLQEQNAQVADTVKGESQRRKFEQARETVVNLLKAEFGYKDENPKINEKTEGD